MYIYGTYNYSYCFCLTKTHNWGGHIISVHYQSLFYPMAVNSSTIPLVSNFFGWTSNFHGIWTMKSHFSWQNSEWHPNFHGTLDGLHDMFMTFSRLFWRQPVSGLVKHQAAGNRIPVRQLGYKVGPPRSTIAKLGFTSLQLHYGKIHLY